MGIQLAPKALATPQTSKGIHSVAARGAAIGAEVSITAKAGLARISDTQAYPVALFP